MDDIDHLIKTVFEQTEIKWQEVSQYIANTSLDGGRYSIFYNDPFHTLKKGDIYLVGLNPGGDPQKTKFNVKDEISEFKKFYSSHNRSFSAYLDEVWGNTGSEYEKGQASHQKRVKELIESVSNCLGQFCSVRDIFAANLIFFRTKSKNELSYVPPLAPAPLNEDGSANESGSRIPPEYLESLFGPPVHGALDTLKSEMERRRRGEKSDLMDILIMYKWTEALGPLARDPVDITW